MRSERILLFDYGGVIAHNDVDDASEEMCRLFSVSRADLRRLLKEGAEPGQSFRQGRISEEEFWKRISKMAGVDRDSLPTDQVLSRLWADRYSLNDDMIRLMISLRKNYLIGCLTNIDKARDAYLTQNSRFMSLVDIHFATWSLGVTKQMPEIWNIVNGLIIERFPHVKKIFFIDDREEHVEAGKACGWSGIKFETVCQCRALLVANGYDVGE